MTPVPVPRAGTRQIARDMGIGERNADLLASLTVERGLREIEEDPE